MLNINIIGTILVYCVYMNIHDLIIVWLNKDYLIKLCLFIVISTVTAIACSKIIVSSLFLTLILRGIICIIVPSIVYLLMFSKNNELQYLFSILKNNPRSKQLKQLFIN